MSTGAARKARRASGGNDNDESKGGERGGAGNPGIEPLEIERDDQPMLNSKTGKSRRSLRQERNELRASRESKPFQKQFRRIDHFIILIEDHR